MKKIKLSIILGLALASLPVCGAWTDGQDDTVRYDGGHPISVYASEQVGYVTKTVVEDVSTDGNAPAYNNTSLDNSCGAVAGAIVAGFYDKYYENMIPNWSSCYTTGFYKPQSSTYVGPVINELFTLMKTNSLGAGVSEDDFKSGLTSYVSNQGYSLTYDSLGRSGSFDYTKYKTAVRNNQVSVLLIEPSYVYNLSAGSGADVLTSTYINGNHIMVAYGYLEIKYTLSSGTRTDAYLRVVTGWGSPTLALYKVGSYVDAAYVTKIS